MASLDEQILVRNPWWGRPSAVEEDPHLQTLRRVPFQWHPPLLESLPLVPGSAHTLRGPRQAGKTTLAKVLIRRLLEAGESRILYFSFDFARRPEALYEVMNRAKELHPDPVGPWYFFLDEVTSVPDWQKGVKVAWDQGLVREDFLLLTGSSARDLKVGAEQLPGRRGDGVDLLHLPMSFRDFCTQVEGIHLPEDPCCISDFLQARGRRLARELYLSIRTLSRSFQTYLRIGGFPVAVRDYVASDDGSARPQSVRMLWDALAGDIARSGRDQTAAAKLLEEVAVSLGSPLKWQGAARSMGMASGATAREYVEHLSESFALLAVYFWDLAGGSLQPSKQRKVYFLDPLFAEIAPLLMPGARRPPGDAAVENAVASGLFRSSASALTQSGAEPGAVGYWRSAAGREIDFVVPAEERGRGGRLPLEVKGDNASAISRARMAIRNAFGEGVVASRTEFDPRGPVPVIPVPVLLAALGERSKRGPGTL